VVSGTVEGVSSHTHRHQERSLNALAFSATVHCLTGCAIGEVLGMIIGTALEWSDLATIAISIALAFVFGYSLTCRCCAPAWPSPR
jgi:NhaP-type Na+/H+ or K+/H+ antiporter